MFQIAYILTPLSFIILVILLVRSITLEGATDGLMALLIPFSAESLIFPKVCRLLSLPADAYIVTNLCLETFVNPNLLILRRYLMFFFG